MLQTPRNVSDYLALFQVTAPSDKLRVIRCPGCGCAWTVRACWLAKAGPRLETLIIPHAHGCGLVPRARSDLEISS